MSPISDLGFSDFRLTDLGALRLTSGGHEEATNARTQEWIPFFENPWVEPSTVVVTEKGQPAMDRDFQFVERSRSVLRKWLDENPY